MKISDIRQKIQSELWQLHEHVCVKCNLWQGVPIGFFVMGSQNKQIVIYFYI